jgi:hypothetical protein
METRNVPAAANAAHDRVPADSAALDRVSADDQTEQATNSAAPTPLAEWLGEAPRFSHAGLVLTAASVGLAGPKRRLARLDRLMARLGRGEHRVADGRSL